MTHATLDHQIAAGARTVVQLHAQLDELRSQAVTRLAEFLVNQRTYLTPSEDERVRQLLDSYWHARGALLNTVTEFRETDIDATDVDACQRDQVFLVGFTAALILVDAARFLGELCRPHPVIAAKLNEPEAHFGIPAGVYNMIQENLTAPINAWHLYHANKHFTARQSHFIACADGDDTLLAVLALAQRLDERVQISKREYGKARLRVSGKQFSRAVTTDTFGRAASFVIEMCSRAVGKIRVRPGHRPGLPLRIRDALAPLLQTGDVIVTRKQYAATNYFLPGYWPHAILYLGDCEYLQSLGLHEHEHMQPRWQRLLKLDADDPRRVLEAMADGVRLRSILSAFSVDAVAVIRPRLTIDERVQGIARGLFHESKPYDFDFDFTRSSRLVCTEVVYRSYEGIGGLEFPLTERIGRPTLAAEDLLRMALTGNGFDLVAVCLPDAEALAVGEAAEKQLRRSLKEARS